MVERYPSVSYQMPNKDDLSWDKCIKRESIFELNKLSRRIDIMPSKSELNEAVRMFGPKALSRICNVICRRIMSTSKDFIGVLPSYRIVDSLLESSVSVVFVVTLKKNAKNTTICMSQNYDYHIKFENQFSNEGKLVALKEMADESVNTEGKMKSSFTSSSQYYHFENYNHTENKLNKGHHRSRSLPKNYYDDILKRMRTCINKNADDLLEKHSNLNVIMPSLRKSVGYSSDRHEIIDEPCIALYVTVKGFVPLQEEPFKNEIDDFKIDVLEGEFEPYIGGPNDYHEHMKSGLAIHAQLLNGGGILGGTLGGFVDHAVHGLCAITCAHVLYNSLELNDIIENESFEPKRVYQPICDGSQSFGQVVKAIFKEGDQSIPGMDVALIQIQSRLPIDGSFPEALNDIESGFDRINPLRYNSGEICDSSRLKRRTEVFKFGMSTGITRGSFELQGAIVRKRQMNGQHHGIGFNLKNQIVILQIGEKAFAEPGDSGSLVLMEGEQDNVAVGIVEGGMNGRVFVTPICNILRAVGCTETRMHQFNQMQNQDFVDLEVEMEF